MTPDAEDEAREDEPIYPTMSDLPDPDHHRGPTAMPPPAYDADMLNFLQHTVEDSFYRELILAIESASKTIWYKDQLGGLYPAISSEAAAKLKFLADKYVKPPEYVVTNIKDAAQFRSIVNDFRMDAKIAKHGLHKIDYNNTCMSIFSAMENHLKGAKLTRSSGGFERISQQTQRAELSSTYEHKKPPTQSSGLSRLLGRG